MAILVLEQVALPEDYVAVFETSGLIERLLRADSPAVVDAAAKIAVASKNESVFDRFCEMIGLGDATCLDIGARPGWDRRGHPEWISSIAVEAFFRDPRNQSVESISFHDLSNLTYLRLVGLSQLSVVELNLGLTSLHLEDLPALEQAGIFAPGLVELSFSGMENLKQLELSCSISALPKEIGDLCALEELSLTGILFKSLPDSIGQLSNLKNLNLSGSGLTHLPDSIGQLSQLQNLNLNGSGVTRLPESIGGLTSLTSLDLSSTYLVNIPAGIGQMKSLQHLILPTTLESIPHEIGCLTALETMWFGPSQWGWESDKPDAVANRRIILDLCRQLEGAVKC